MNKNKKKFSCLYCAKEFLRGSMGYANHFRTAHPDEYTQGRMRYPNTPASKWPFIVIHPMFRDGAPRTPDQVIKLDSDLKDLVQIGNEVNGCWSVTFNPKSDQDPVNHPPHYGGGDNPYEAIKVIHAWGLGFDLGNVLKYIRRADLKGTPIQDLEKAKFYLEDEIKRRKEVASFDAQT